MLALAALALIAVLSPALQKKREVGRRCRLAAAIIRARCTVMKESELATMPLPPAAAKPAITVSISADAILRLAATYQVPNGQYRVGWHEPIVPAQWN
jgi:hypothetical protein